MALTPRLGPVETLADLAAIERVPLADRFAAESTYDMIRAAALAAPERAALVFLRDGTADEPPVTLSYGELLAQMTRFANALHRLGMGPADSVSILLPNLIEMQIAMWGGEAAGIINPINPLLEPGQIADIISAAGSRILVTLGPLADPAFAARAVAIREQAPRLRWIIQIGAAPDAADPILDFAALLAAEPGDRLVSGRVIRAADIASYFHTGGTTGSPKLAPHTHRNEAFIAWISGALNGYGDGSVVCNGLPMFHIAGGFGGALAPLANGATVVMLSAAGFRNPSVLPHFWRIVERYRVEAMLAVPTVFSALLNVPLAGADLSSVAYFTCGAAPLSVELVRAFEAATGVRIVEIYGMTEGGTGTANPTVNTRTGSIGLRLPYCELKIVRPDGDACAVDEPGVLAMRGPHVFPGYKEPKNNEDAWLAGGWFNTGDLGRQDAEGYVWLTGRAKDLIIRGGHNIDPSVIEETLYRHPAVALAAAVGRPDIHAGELPVAYVSLRPGAAATEEALREFARASIAERAAAPVEVRIIETMPVTAVGKIFKPALRRHAIEAVYRAALAERGLEAEVSVGADPKLGALALITPLSTIEPEQIRAALGGFTIPWRLVDTVAPAAVSIQNDSGRGQGP